MSLLQLILLSHVHALLPDSGVICSHGPQCLQACQADGSVVRPRLHHRHQHTAASSQADGLPAAVVLVAHGGEVAEDGGLRGGVGLRGDEVFEKVVERGGGRAGLDGDRAGVAREAGLRLCRRGAVLLLLEEQQRLTVGARGGGRRAGDGGGTGAGGGRGAARAADGDDWNGDGGLAGRGRAAAGSGGMVVLQSDGEDAGKAQVAQAAEGTDAP